MITRTLLNSNKKLVNNIISVRTKIHPTPARVELVQGRSAVGKPAAFEPYRIEIEKGKSYAWCACGASKKQPFCDGSHKKLNAELKEGQEKFGPLRFICEEARSALLCMCKKSSNRPFCDGTHATLKSKETITI